MPDVQTIAGRVPTDQVDPQMLVQALLRNGWAETGFRTNDYVRLKWPPDHDPRGRNLVVPLDRAAPEYAEMMGGVLAKLDAAAASGRAAHAVLEAAGGHAVKTPDPLVSAMHSIWLHGKWPQLLQRMTTEEKQAAVAAVTLYRQWLHPNDDQLRELDRNDLARWE